MTIRPPIRRCFGRVSRSIRAFSPKIASSSTTSTAADSCAARSDWAVGSLRRFGHQSQHRRPSAARSVPLPPRRQPRALSNGWKGKPVPGLAPAAKHRIGPDALVRWSS